MPIGAPFPGGGGGAFGVSSVNMPNSFNGVSISVSSQSWKLLPYTNRWLYSADSPLTFARSEPYLCDDPRVNAYELVPNFPVVGSDTNVIYLGSSPLFHFFNLRVLDANGFWRTPHDFSSWTNLPMPLNFGMSFYQLGVINDTPFGDMLVYPGGPSAPQSLYYSTDNGVNWSIYSTGTVGSVWQAESQIGNSGLSGAICIGFRDSIVKFDKPFLDPFFGVVFPKTITTGPPVGTGGNYYTAWASAPDGRMAAGTNNGRINWSLNGGALWQAKELGGPLSAGAIRGITWNPDDDYFYLCRVKSVERTLDFANIEQIGILSDVPSNGILSEVWFNSGPLDGGVIISPNRTEGAQPRVFWSVG